MKIRIPPLPTGEEFAGRTEVVTGGRSGLGLHLAATLAGFGAEVFFCGRNAEAGRKAEEATGPRGHFVRCDLAHPGETAAFVKRAGAQRPTSATCCAIRRCSFC